MKLIYLMFLSFTLTALSWVVLTPIWQYPDEQAHFAQVQNLAELNTIKSKNGFDTSSEITIAENILATSRASGNNKFTYHPEFNIPYTTTRNGVFETQLRELPKSSRVNLVKTESTANPPLYYFGGSFAYKLFYNSSMIERVFAIRIYSLGIFLLNTLVVFFASRYIFERDIFSRVLLTTLVALMPMHIHASTGILPDPLTNLIFSTFLFISLGIVNNSISIKKILLLALLVFAGYLTRQQFLILVPVGFYALILNQIKKGQLKKIITVTISMIVVLAVFLNFKIAIPEIGHAGFGIQSISDLLLFSIWTAKHTYSEVLPWYWGVYRWLSLTLPHPVYQMINRIILISLVDFVWIVLEKIRKKKLNQDGYNLVFVLGSSLIYFTIFMLGDYYFSRQYGYSFGIQGRYFFPLIFAHMTLLLVGLLKVTTILKGKLEIVSKPILLLSILIFNIFSLYFVTSSYYDTSTFSNFMAQASQYKPVLIKGLPMLAIPILATISQVLFLSMYTATILKKTQ